MARMRRSIAAAVAALLASLAAVPGADAAHGQAPLGRRLAKALTVPHVSPARSAALAVDLATGKVLYGRNQSLSLAPASNEKLPLTYALLATLGPAFRIDTEVLGEGQLEGTIWHGDLVLRGYGDPSLSTADLRVLAQQVRAQGIRRVSGSIRGDETYFDTRRTAPGWKASFYGAESAPLSALVVDRDRPFAVLEREPALAAATVFRKTLKAAGVAVTGPATAGSVAEFSVPLASVSSPTLATLIRYMDRESDNFTAEMLLKVLGAAQSDVGTSAAGAAAVTTALADAGIPLAGVRIVDGSGLSRLDRLTAGALVGVLQASWADPNIRPFFVSALPVAGRQRNVRAKTGTPSDASALSERLPAPQRWARVAQDRFATVLAAS